MATPLEDKFVTYLKTQNGSGGDLQMVKKIFSDPPRTDLSTSSFPRIRVKEEQGPGTKRGFAAEKREYLFDLRILVYVAQDINVKKGAAQYSGPSQAPSKISYDIIDNLNTNIASLRSGDPAVITVMSYEGTVPALEFVNEFDVLVAEVTVEGRYYR